MRKKDNEEMSSLADRVLILLGIATGLLHDCFEKYPESEKKKYYWFLDAVNEVVYKDNPIPPFWEN